MKITRLAAGMGLTGILLAGAGCSKAPSDAEVRKALSQQGVDLSGQKKMFVSGEDLDKDGKKENIAFVSNGEESFYYLLQRDGAGNLSVVDNSKITYAPKGRMNDVLIDSSMVSFEDKDGDGREDVVILPEGKNGPGVYGRYEGGQLHWKRIEGKSGGSSRETTPRVEAKSVVENSSNIHLQKAKVLSERKRYDEATKIIGNSEKSNQQQSYSQPKGGTTNRSFNSLEYLFKDDELLVSSKERCLTVFGNTFNCSFRDTDFIGGSYMWNVNRLSNGEFGGQVYITIVDGSQEGLKHFYHNHGDFPANSRTQGAYVFREGDLRDIVIEWRKSVFNDDNEYETFLGGVKSYQKRLKLKQIRP